MKKDSPIQVLVIDDEPSIRESLSEFLEIYGFEVSEAGSGEDGLKILEQKKHNVAIVDLRLPGISGESMILEAFKKNSEMKFLIHTGSIDYTISESLKNISISKDNVLYKPTLDLKLFVDKINDLMDNENIT